MVKNVLQLAAKYQRPILHLTEQAQHNKVEIKPA